MKDHGPWKITGTKQVYQDPWLSLRRDDVLRPDGAPGTHVVVQIKPGVSVLPIDDGGCVYLADEFHYAVGRNTLEVVSGGIDPGEDALTAAQRELREELGITAARWTSLGAVDPFTSTVVSPTQLYLAQGLTFGKHEREGTEFIRCVKVTLAEAVAAVRHSRITHAPSAVLILKAHLHLLGEPTP
jgi:ADP-ribose pyrophosphatase